MTKLAKSKAFNMLTTSQQQGGFLHLPNDNVIKTIAVATLLCLVCSVVVSVTATVLKPTQVENKLLDRKANILTVAGLNDPSKSIDELFSQIESQVIEFDSGELRTDVDAVNYDQRKASKDPARSASLDKTQDIASISRRADLGSVYLLKDGEQIDKIILPVKGYGLWSTMHGFLALEGDAKTVSGITFYDHGETPGLGGEIENKKWQASWQGKQVFDGNGEVALKVIKGNVDPAGSQADYQIDGLAGATLTSQADAVIC